jgi:hypothetical protein
VIVLRVLAAGRSLMTMAVPRRRAAAAVVAAVGAAGCVLLAVSGPASAATRPGTVGSSIWRWGSAEPVPGLAALNKGFSASVSAVSCWRAGDCAAAGHYTDRHHHSQAFVAMERNGRWGRPEEVPGTAALNKGGNAQVGSVSCTRTSACVAVGSYTDKKGNEQWFTVSGRNARWGTAAEVPHPSLADAGISTVWCAPGLCAAGGTFTDGSAGTQAWVRTETYGGWHAALEVPGIQALSSTAVPPFSSPVSYSAVTALSCTSAGNCAAGGQYELGTSITDNGFPPDEAFVVNETNGTWATAEEVPGLAKFNQIAWSDGDVTAMSCPSAGNCTAAGYYQTDLIEYCGPPAPSARPARVLPHMPAQPSRAVPAQPNPPPYGCEAGFVVNEKHGTWGQAQEAGDSDVIASLACPAAGDCVVGGYAPALPPDCPPSCPAYRDGVLQSERSDHWGSAVELSAISSILAVSCSSEGNCGATAVGQSGNAYLMSEFSGTWAKPVKPAGLPGGDNYQPVNAVSCPPATSFCLAGGFYTGPKGGMRAILVGRSN